MIRFNLNDFSVSVGGKTISLLPKEFSLLQFLWENKKHSFSREQLLDAVWGLENPGERTVDDHVYRIRRKLRDVSYIVKIDTVRGLGYRLSIEESPGESPFLQDMELNDKYSELFTKYWLYGHGSAMELLADNKDILGISLHPQDAVYLHFMSGDFQKLVRTSEVSFFEKVFYLLHIFRLIQFDAEKTLYLFEKVLAQGHRLPPHHREELEFNLISIYCEAGKVEAAEQKLRAVERSMAGHREHGYTLFLCADKIMLSFIKGDLAAVERNLAEAKKMLAITPYLRESGILKIAKGLWLLYLGQKNAANSAISEGLAILKKSQFVPHYLFGVHIILFFLGRYIDDSAALQKYSELWTYLDRTYCFADLTGEIYTSLTARL